MFGDLGGHFEWQVQYLVSLHLPFLDQVSQEMRFLRDS